MSDKPAKKATLEGLTAPIEGLSITKNAKNGFTIIELDFFADPAKRSQEWIDNERRRMPPKQWAIEMERSWETYAGKPVYDLFHKHLSVLKAYRRADESFPIFRGWDFGGNQSVAICQIIDGKLYVIDEIPNGGLNTRIFAPEVIAYCNAKYGNNVHYVDVVDPSSFWEGKTATGAACTDVLRDFGIEPIPAPTNDPVKRIDAVTKLLTTVAPDGMTALRLNPTCPKLIEGFEGGYHYPDKPSQTRRMDRPVKNLFSHCLAGDTSFVNTPNGPALISQLRVGDTVTTPTGPQQVTAVMSRHAQVYELTFSDGSVVEATEDHPFPTRRGIVFTDALCYGDVVWGAQQFTQSKHLMGSGSIENPVDTTKQTTALAGLTCTDMCGAITMEPYRQNIISTIKTATDPITKLKISNLFRHLSTPNITAEHAWLKTQESLINPSQPPEKPLRPGIDQPRAELGIACTPNPLLDLSNSTTASSVPTAMPSSEAVVSADFALPTANRLLEDALVLTTSSANVLYAMAPSTLIAMQKHEPAVRLVGKRPLPQAKRVYDLTVDSAHAFFVNGILTLNCHDSLQYVALRMSQHLENLEDETVSYESALTRTQYRFRANKKG